MLSVGLPCVAQRVWPMPVVPFERLGFQPLLQIHQLAFGAAALDLLAFKRGDARGIVAAIFKTFERIHQLLCNRLAPENADNPAHADQYPPNRRKIA